MGVSIRAYARHRGVSDTAVRKALRAGRIVAEADGSIDPARADAAWVRTTDPAQQRPVPGRDPPRTAAPPATEPALSTGGVTSFLQARTVNEVVKAQTNRVRLQRLQGELVDRSQAIAHVFRLARAERDAWLNWPARVAPALATTFSLEVHAVHEALATAVREHLAELGELRPRIN